MVRSHIKLIRGPEMRLLIKNHPNAFILLTIIAERACRTNDHPSGLEIGQSLVGDYDNYGMTRQQYRLAIRCLKVNHLVVTKGTNKGTIATLLDESIYDINADTGEPTKNHPGNQRRTTNKNEKNIKNEKNRKDTCAILLLNLWNEEAINLPKAIKMTEWRKKKTLLRLKENPLEKHRSLIQRINNSHFCQGNGSSGWRASFNWYIKNEEVAVKIEEGQYDNQEDIEARLWELRLEKAKEEDMRNAEI